MNFRKFIDKFIEYMRLMKNASEHTVRAYETDLSSFYVFLITEKLPTDLTKISKKEVRAYLAKLHDEKKSTKTVLRRISSLRSLYRYGTREELVSKNPLEEIESPKKGKKLPISISYEQVEHLLSQPAIETYLGYRDRVIMEIFYSSGLRLSELVGLNREDFDPSRETLNIFGKGKKQRITPITASAANWLSGYLNHPQRYEKDKEAIFLNRFGTRLTSRSVDRSKKVACLRELPLIRFDIPLQPIG